MNNNLADEKINKIVMRRLVNLEVWRFVCLVFAVIGLLSNALSADFNHLFGQWNWWKILVYSVISIIICLAVFFIEARTESPSLKLTSIVSFVALLGTNFYSHFSDEKLDRKQPDAYSLISTASLAIASLSFSIPCQCGFEKELCFFFGISFTIQLMEIHDWLGVFGVAFTAFLAWIRYSLDLEEKKRKQQLPVQDPLVNSNSRQTSALLRETWENEEQGLTQQQLKASPGDNQGNISTDIGALRRHLTFCMDNLKENNKLVVDQVAKQVNSYLKAMDDYSKDPEGSQQPPQIDLNLVLDFVVQLCSEEFNELREVVKCMVSAGLEKECREAYSDWRWEFLIRFLLRFGFRELMMEVNDLKKKTHSWGVVLTVAVKILLPMEARFHDFATSQLFGTKDTSFTELCSELITQLLRHADSLLNEAHSPDLLCRVIPVVGNTLDALQLDPFIKSNNNELDKVWKRLGEETKGIFTELENLIHSHKVNLEELQKPLLFVPPAKLHCKVFQVMKCIRDVSKFGDVILRKAFGRKGKSSFSMQIAKIIDFLESSSEAMLKDFENPAFGYLFMMNNLRITRRLATKFKLESKLGRDWVLKNEEKVQQNLEHFIESSWNKLLDDLKPDDNVAAETMKENLQLFNQHFEKICNDQYPWFVFDKHLREQIRNSIQDILLRAYENFKLKLYSVLGKQPYPYIECDLPEFTIW